MIKGLVLAAGAVTASTVVANGQVGHGGRVLAVVVGGTAGIAGIAAVLHTRHARDLPANVAENSRRRATRTAANAEIARRNSVRVGETVLIIAPAAGVGP